VLLPGTTTSTVSILMTRKQLKTCDPNLGFLLSPKVIEVSEH